MVVNQQHELEEPVAEQVVEEALLALGPQLEWKPFTSFTSGLSLPSPGSLVKGERANVRVEEPAGDYYTVHEEVPTGPGSHPRYAAQLAQMTVVSYGIKRYDSDNPYWCPTRSAAKAACERHHATGKWE